MSKFNILIAGNNDPISSKGIDLLKAEPSFSVTVNMDLKAEDKMIEASRDAHAIIVRKVIIQPLYYYARWPSLRDQRDVR